MAYIYKISILKYYLCMSSGIDKSSYLSTREAADLFGVTQHQVAQLCRSGEVAFKRIAGNALLVDSRSLRQYIQLRKGRGRPFDQKTALAALWMLSGLPVDWLEYPQLRRLKIRLAQIDADSLVWLTRRRSEVRAFRVSRSFANEISGRLILTGSSDAVAQRFGLTPRGDTVEGYVVKSDLPCLEEDFFLVDDSDGNVVLRVADWLPDWNEAAMPAAVCAADLATSLNTRERSAGIRVLEAMLDEYASNRSNGASSRMEDAP